MRLLISYNPYLLNTTFLIDGELSDAAWAKYLRNRRLQTWFYSAPNWEGMGAELEKALNETSVEVGFNGRELDYSDLELYFKEWNQRPDKKTAFHLLPQEVFLREDQDILQILDNLVATFKGSPVESMRDPKLLERYQEARGQDFQMAVVATMSSGKSTLINALLGQDLLPTANDATTAKISRIRDVDGSEGFTVECRDKDEKLIHDQKPATPTLLKGYNEDKDVFYVDLEGDIPGISSEALRLNIIDTPGPNNSATDEHRDVTNSILRDRERQPIILYVLDSTKPEIVSDAALLKDIANEIKAGGRQATERFIFVMNKADQVKRNDGTVSEVIRRRQDYLQKLGIDANQIIPVNAYAAMLLRMKHTNQEIDPEEDAFLGYARLKKLDQAALLTPGCKNKLDEMKRQAEEQGDQYMLDLIATGIVGLELTIEEYLKKYAYPYKISQIIQTFQNRLKDELQHANFADHIARDEKALAEAEKNLEEVIQKKDELTEGRRRLERQTNKVKFDAEVLTAQRLEFNMELGRALQSLRERWGLSSADASLPIASRDSFLQEVERAQKVVADTMQVHMQNQLDVKIREDFDKIYAEYRAFFQGVCNIKISNIDFGSLEKMCDMEKILTAMSKKSLKTMIDNNSLVFEKTHKKIVKVKNPERNGLLGLFKVWKQWRIDDTVILSDGDYIDVVGLFGAISQETTTILSSLFSKIENDIQALYIQKKQMCFSFLGELDDSIQKEVDRITELKQSVEGKRFNIENNLRCKIWMEETMQDIDGLTQIQQQKPEV